jgi:hypothetical protein
MVEEFLMTKDEDYDGVISSWDNMTNSHWETLYSMCDFNNDWTVDACEVHTCIVMSENEWRAEYCPDM